MTDTTKRYRLLKDYKTPKGTCYEGVTHTARDWQLEWFPYLQYADFDIKDDWFAVEVLPVSEKVKEKIEVVDLYQLFKNPDTKGRHSYSIWTNSEMPKDKFPAIKQAIESALNDTVVEDRRIEWCGIIEHLKSFKNTPDAASWLKGQFDVLHFNRGGSEYDRGWKDCFNSPDKKYTQSEVDAIRAEDLKFIQLLQNQLREQPTNDNAFVWTDELVKDFVIAYNKVDKLITGIDPIGQTIKEWKQSKQSAPVDTGKNDLIEISYKRFSNGEMKPENTFMLIPSDIFEETKQAIQSVFDKHYPKPLDAITEPSALPNKEWEIMSYTSKTNFGFDALMTKLPDGKWALDFRLGFNEPISEKELPPNKDIHSVRRLSDNTVFSVGDKIFDGWEGEHSHFSGTVTGFEIYLTGMLIKYGEGGKTMHIANAAKQKLNK